MAKKASVKQLLQALAKERGIDVTDIDKLKGTGVIGRLEEGAGFGEAFGETAKEKIESAKKAVSKKGLKKLGKKAYMTFFGGEDIFSAYMRGRLRKGEKNKDETDGGPEAEGGSVGGDSLAFIKIIAKNSMSIPWMARDMNVMRQNIQKLVKLKAGPQKKGTKAYATSADAFFLKEDERERALEVQRSEIVGKKTTPTPEKGGEGSGGFIDSIMEMFSGGFMNAIKTIFSPKMLMKAVTKVFLPLVIIGSLFNGIMDGFKKYQETGSFTDAIVAGFGGMLSFVTFGFFGEDTLKKLFQNLNDFFSPIAEVISNVFNSVKDFIKRIFGSSAGEVEDKSSKEIAKTQPEMPNPKDFAINAAKASGASDEKAKDLGNIFGSMGDPESMFKKAQEFSKKYPEPATPTSPTPEIPAVGISPEQAQRNFELNKQMTGEASKMLGIPLEAPKGPSAPTPVQPEPNTEIKQLEEYFNRPENAAQNAQLDDVQNRINAIRRGISSTKALMRDEKDPIKLKQHEDILKNQLEPGLEAAKTEKKALLDAARASLKGQPTTTPTTPTVTAQTTGATTDSGTIAMSGGGMSPSTDTSKTAPSGAEMSQASSDVSEGQRMESAADAGSLINAPVTNNQIAKTGGAKPPIADVWNSDFVKMLATT